MTDFLSRLAARALGTAEVLRPRVGSIFEPRDTLVERTETIEATAPAAAALATAPRGETRPPVVELLAAGVRARVEPVSASEPPAAPRSPEPAVEALPRADRAPPVAAAPTAPEHRSARAAAAPVGLERREPRHAGERTPPVPGEAPRRDVHAEIARRAPVPPDAPIEAPVAPGADVGARRPRAGGGREPAPIVHVTIGRVDVRAVLPEERPAPPERARPPRMSLDEYLAKSRT